MVPTKTHPGSRRAIGAAMGAVVAVLIVGLALLIHWTTIIGRESTNVVTNAFPSTTHLAAARAALRGVDAEMNEMLSWALAGRPIDRAAIEAQRRLLDAELNLYRALPTYPGERERAELVAAELGRFDSAMAEGLRLLAGPDPQRARDFETGPWRRASNRLDEAIRSLINLNTEHLGAHAARIDRLWRIVVVAAVALGISCVALSLVSGALAIRAIRRHERFLEERTAELELFSARVAHDLLSPLGSVAIAVQVAEQTSQDDQIVRLSSRAMSSIRRLQTVVAALLEFARAGGRPATSTTALAPFVMQLLDELRPLAEEARIELSCVALPRVEVACSPGILSVLLSNLIRNAIQWMGESPIRRVELSVTAGQRRARFEVRDTGPGLSAEVERRLFEPFTRPAPTGIPGVGVGLATVKRLVEAHRGVVAVRSNDEHGTIFWFELPVARSVPAP